LSALSQRAAQRIASHSAWIVIPIAALLLFPSEWMSVGFAAAVFLFVCRWIARGNPFPASRANVFILILLTLTAISLAISPAPDLAVLTAAQVVASVTVFFAVLDQIQSAPDLWRAAAALAILGTLIAFAAPFTVGWSPDKVYGIPFFYESGWPRLPKVSNANIVAGALAPIVPVALGLILQGARRLRILGALALAPICIVLLLLQSRGALFALGAGLAVWATLYRRWLLPLIPIGLIAALYINQAYGGPPPAQFFFGKIGTPTGGTLFERQDMWFQAAHLIRQSPLLGIGLGAYPRVAPYAFPYSAAQPGLTMPHAHNLFLQIGLDIGIFGAAAFVVLLASAIFFAWQAFRARFERHFAIGTLAALVILSVHGLGDSIVWGTAKPSIILWMVLGLTNGLDKIRKVL
jgi:putative inorganic carbon (HCO3(-)) transporter